MIRKVNLLCVEDDEADVDLIQCALNELNRKNIKIHTIEDGEEAMKFFEREGKYSDREFPHLILLDLNLPKVGGKEVLKYLKNSKEFKSIPVIVLTTSAAQSDVEDIYSLGASGFITKPSNYTGYKETVQKICEYWTETCIIPDKLF